MSHAARDITSGRARPPAPRSLIVPTVFALAAFGALIALGVWQLHRRDWKNDLIARFEQALAKPPIPYEPPQNADENAREFMRVEASGAFEEAKTVKMLVPTPEDARAETQEGFGYLLFTPVKLDSGAVVFVNRGFAPQSVADRSGAPRGKATVTELCAFPQSRAGCCRLPISQNAFSFPPTSPRWDKRPGSPPKP